MAKANISKQLRIETENKIGMFAEVASAVSNTGINIIAFCAYGEASKAVFYMITNDNAKAKEALSKRGLKVSESEVVTLMLEDRPGAAKDIAIKIKDSGVNLDYVYGTTCGCAPSKALMVIASKDINSVLSAING